MMFGRIIHSFSLFFLVITGILLFGCKRSISSDALDVKKFTPVLPQSIAADMKRIGKSDWTEMHLKGRVRKMTLLYNNLENKKVVYLFNQKGYIVEKETSDVSTISVNIRESFEYGDYNQIVKNSVIDQGAVPSRKEYEYTYLYAVNPADRSIYRERKSVETDSNGKKKAGKTVREIYDSSGVLRVMGVFNSDNATDQIGYYDEHGNETGSMMKLTDSGDIFESTCENSYTSGDILVRIKKKDSVFGETVTEKLYSETGQMVTSTTYSMDDESSLFTARTDYTEFDPKGNVLTEKLNSSVSIRYIYEYF
jgi:hypothetical protein